MNEDLVAYDDTPDEHILSTWARVYLHGLVVLIGFCVIAYGVTLLLPMFDFIGHRGLATLLAIAVILLGPPLVGSIVLFALFPLIGRKEGWRGLLSWDDRVIAEVSNAKEKAQIVIVNWPSATVRTMGVMTSHIECPDSGKTLAIVYIPTAPQTRLGYIRVVDMDELEITEWSLRQWQMYQLSFGSANVMQSK